VVWGKENFYSFDSKFIFMNKTLRSILFVGLIGLTLFTVELWSVKEGGRAAYERRDPVHFSSEYVDSVVTPELFVGIIVVILASFLYFRKTISPSLRNGFLFGVGIVGAWLLIEILIAIYLYLTTLSHAPLSSLFLIRGMDVFSYNALFFIPAGMTLLTASLSGWLIGAKQGKTLVFWLLGLGVCLIILSAVVA